MSSVSLYVRRYTYYMPIVHVLWSLLQNKSLVHVEDQIILYKCIVAYFKTKEVNKKRVSKRKSLRPRYVDEWYERWHLSKSTSIKYKEVEDEAD